MQQLGFGLFSLLQSLPDARSPSPTPPVSRVLGGLGHVPTPGTIPAATTGRHCNWSKLWPYAHLMREGGRAFFPLLDRWEEYRSAVLATSSWPGNGLIHQNSAETSQTVLTDDHIRISEGGGHLHIKLCNSFDLLWISLKISNNIEEGYTFHKNSAWIKSIWATALEGEPSPTVSPAAESIWLQTEADVVSLVLCGVKGEYNLKCLFLFTDPWGRVSYLSLLFFGTLHSDGYIFPFLFCFSLHFFSQPVVRAPQTAILVFAFLFLGDGLDPCLLYSVMDLHL